MRDALEMLLAWVAIAWTLVLVAAFIGNVLAAISAPVWLPVVVAWLVFEGAA